MRHVKAPRLVHQLGLFHARPIAARWTDLPTDVRQQTLALLARLLRLHHHTLLVERPAAEVRDE